MKFVYTNLRLAPYLRKTSARVGLTGAQHFSGGWLPVVLLEEYKFLLAGVGSFEGVFGRFCGIVSSFASFSQKLQMMLCASVKLLIIPRI